MARKHKTKYAFPPAALCGYVKADGKPCGRTKAKDKKTGAQLKHCNYHLEADVSGVDLGLLPGATYAPPPDMPLESLSDLAYVIADTLNRVRQGQIPTKIGQTVATLANPLIKALEAREKLDPVRQAKSQLTREEIIRRAQQMSDDDLRKVAEDRDDFINAVVVEPEPKLLEAKEAAEVVKSKEFIDGIREIKNALRDEVKGEYNGFEEDERDTDEDE